MDISSATLLYFSPTRTTRAILEGITGGMPGITMDRVDLTPPDALKHELAIADHALAVIGAPVYAGRIPLEAIRRLQRVRGQSTPAIVVVVYGNRAYDDALLELRDVVAERGFVPVAAGAFIGEHSFSTTSTPIAVARPDAQDLSFCRGFGAQTIEKVRRTPVLNALPAIAVPGNMPYKERRAPFHVCPVRDEALCVLCGNCASVCPMAAITIGETVVSDPDVCILCCACVRQCPQGARSIADVGVRQIAERLHRTCGVRRNPEIYL